MNNRYLSWLMLALCLLSVPPTLFSAPIPETAARQAASTFYAAATGQAASTLTLVRLETLTYLHDKTLPDPQPIYYLFNVGTDQGFVLVSGDDRVKAILGYSPTGSHNAQRLPDAVAKWLDMYRKEILYVVEQNLAPSRAIQEEWAMLLAGTYTLNPSRSSVTPLMSTTWDQAPYYNQLCPFDNQYNELTVSGCVATAMAQVMKYWNYPTQGSGFHSYSHNTYGTLSANFGSTTYDWANMPNNLTSNSNAVATLMYHCGVSVDMNYGVAQTGGSGAFVVTAASPKQHCTEYALETYFGYDATSLQGVLRQNYTTSGWVTMLKGELDASRPIVYAGFGNGGGHAWVCDGYDSNDFFHMNWGWGGNSDGYFWVDALNPGSLGAGGGSGGFNSNQQAVIGIQPPGGGGGGGGGGGNPPSNSTVVELYAPINLSANPLPYNSSLTVDFNILNGGSNDPTFNGEVAAALFDDQGAFVDFIGTYTESNGLPGGFVYTNNLSFSTTIDAAPGQYFVGVFVQPSGGNWLAVQSGQYSNPVSLTIENDNDIMINSDFTISPLPIRQNEAVSVNVNVLNTGLNTFTGTYSIDLHQTDGTWIRTLGELNETNGLPPNFTYNGGMTFNVTGGIFEQPGSYLLVLWERQSGGNWEVVGSDGTYANPITITVTAQQIQPDPFENNDNEGSAYPIALNFSANQASFKSTGANIHIGSDWDYYRLQVPNGSAYTIDARAQDSWDSNDGQAYTNDVLFSYSIGGGNTNYSDAYDDVMSAPFSVNGPATVYFKVAPYFQGETGSYALDLKVTQSAANDLENELSAARLRAYPNPAREELFVELPPQAGPVQGVGFYDLMGRAVWQSDAPQPLGERLHLSGWDLPAGVYLLRVQSSAGQWEQPIRLD